MMKRKKREQDEESHERWLVSYADFITLLFAFFVVLYASAQVDAKKAAVVSAAIQGGFQKLGVFSSGTHGKLPDVSPPPPAETAPPPAPVFGVQVDVERLRRELEEALGEEIKKHEVQMRLSPEGLVVSLREVGFFNSGDDVLLPEAQPTFTRIAKVLADRGFEIRVEGHTDNVPIHTAKFRSNWELSTSRATEVVAMLVSRHKFNPNQVSVAGYAEFRPVAPNDTEEGRKMNRRVDLVIIHRRAVTRSDHRTDSLGNSTSQVVNSTDPAG